MSPYSITVRGGRGRQVQEKHDELAWPLDPLMEMLMQFENEAQLNAMISQIFKVPRVTCALPYLESAPHACASSFVSLRYTRFTLLKHRGGAAVR